MSQDSMIRVRFIDRENRRIELQRGEVVLSFPLNPIPDEMYQTILSITENGDTDGERIQRLYECSVTKPSFCTFNPNNPFPINTATKIIRLTLKDEAIVQQIDDLEGLLLSLQGLPFDESIDQRLGIYRDLHLDEGNIDMFRLGAMELFGDVTLANVRSDPRVSLNFRWHEEGAGSRGVQLNCIAEIIKPNEPFYRFMRVMRGLFSNRFLNLRSAEYPCAYKLWIIEVKDKSLKSKVGFVPEN